MSLSSRRAFVPSESSSTADQKTQDGCPLEWTHAIPSGTSSRLAATAMGFQPAQWIRRKTENVQRWTSAGTSGCGDRGLIDNCYEHATPLDGLYIYAYIYRYTHGVYKYAL